MALSANAVISTKPLVDIFERGIVDGLIHIYQGSLLNYEAANIGYVKLASDTASEEFAGVSMEEQDLTAALNTADGTYDVKMYAKGSGRVFLMKVTGGCSRANIGDTVMADGDDAVDFTGGVTHDVAVGTVVDIYSATHAWIKI